MTRIFDNIGQDLLGALRATLSVSKRADFCVGYLNLRGWQAIDDLVQPWSVEAGQICRVLVGMQRPPHDEIRDLYRAGSGPEGLDNATAVRLKTQFAAHLREQITLGIPTGKDEAALRTLARQLRAGQVCIKLFLPYPLHAKLYLLFRDDVNNPITGFVGSSNLTLQGLARQGELNVDVLDHHATARLSSWFDARWRDRWAMDVSADLAALIEASWAREAAIPLHHLYLNIAFHLTTEARAGLSQFCLPARFEQDLFELQKSAVKIVARRLQRRGGVMIGDVVGLHSAAVVDQITALHVPRYGLGLYVDPVAERSASAAERKVIENLGRAGKRLMGFCRTNLFKRLESSGFSCLQSIDGHILRNRIYLHAIENLLDIPVGVLDAGLLDADRIDEAFFEDEQAANIRDLYTGSTGVLDDHDDEVDLASYAWQVWKQATQSNHELAHAVESLPPVVHSAKAFTLDENRLPLLGMDATRVGALGYGKSPEGNDRLAWIGPSGQTVTESQFTILRAAECDAGTPAEPRTENHHDLGALGLQLAVVQDKSVGGGLGRPSSPRRRAYELPTRSAYRDVERGLIQ